MIKTLSLLPLVGSLGCLVVSLGRWVWRGALSVALLCSAASKVVVAQTGLPSAPFEFRGGVHHITQPGFQSDENYRLVEDAVLNVHADVQATLRGTLDSPNGISRRLIKVGGGTLILSGQNAYIGNTMLLQGGLHMDSVLGFGLGGLSAMQGTTLVYSPDVINRTSLNLVAGDALSNYPAYGPYTDPPPLDYADRLQWVVPSGQATHAGILSGSLPFVKQGAGRLTITGDADSYQGQATVNEGTLEVNPWLGGTMRVNRGARLQGIGMVGPTTIMSGGTLAPGNSIGTLMVNGDLVFNAGSRFEAEVSPSGGGDMLRVMGKATLNGDVFALAEAGDWQASSSYTLLSATGGLQGTEFASVTANLAFLTPSLSYDANTVTLTLDRNDTKVTDVAETPDEKDVAEVLDDDGAPPQVTDPVLVLDKPTARSALRQLSAPWAASLQSSVIEDSRFVREAVLDHAGVDADGFWSRAFYSSADRGSYGDAAADERNIHGLVLGVNTPLSANVSAGAFMGLQHSRLRQVAADATIDSTSVGLSVAGQGGPLRFIGGVAHTWHQLKSQRTVAFGQVHDSLFSRYRAQSTQVFGEAAWPIPLAGPSALNQGDVTSRPDRIVLEPFVRLAWVGLNVQGFTETGGPAALRTQASKPSVFFSSVGLRLTHNLESSGSDVGTVIGPAKVSVQIAWRNASGAVRSFARHSFRDSIAQTTFQSEGQTIARNAWSLQLGVSGYVAKNVQLAMSYAGQFARNAQDHGARINLAWAF